MCDMNAPLRAFETGCGHNHCGRARPARSPTI